MHNDSALDQAARLVADGEPEAALAALNGLSDAASAAPAAYIIRSRALVLLNDGDGAHRTLQEARQRFPADADVLDALGQLYIKANAPQAAADTFSELLKKKPEDLRGAEGLATVLLAVGEQAKAVPFLKAVVSRQPDNHLRAWQLGYAYFLSGEYPQSAERLQSLIDVYPENGRTALLAAEAYYNCEQITEARACFEQVVEGPHVDAARSGLVGCLIREGNLDQAIALADSEIERGSSHASGHYVHKASVQTFLNDKPAAIAAARGALALEPGNALAWYVLAEQASGDCSADDVSVMEGVAANGKPVDRGRASFALAKLYADRSDVANEMSWLEKGNKIMASLRPYNKTAMDQFFERIKAQFPPLDRGAVEPGNTGFRPIFILGMPRSGTTLTEQILSSHPDVEGSGESLALLHASGGQGIEARIAQMDSDWIGRFAIGYEQFQRQSGFSASCVTDKAIALYFFAGMLQRAFPDARFIALQRHPMDLALGVWRKFFVTGQAYTFEPRRFAHALSLYRRAIDYWAAQEGINLLRMDYEDLVADPAGWAARLAAHVGVPFDDSMLRPQGNARQVLTASAIQVREGINQKAVGRWKAYGDHLQAFADAYAEFGVPYAQ